MIIRGNVAGNVGFWGKHLQKENTNDPSPDVNDRVQVMEISGLLSTNLKDALREMEAIASGSRSEGNFMYQANINPMTPERLTPEQWKEAVDTLEKELGLEGHQRVVVEHEKHGRVHRHVIWNRVDVDTMLVVDRFNHKQAHERTAEIIEEKFNLERTFKPLLSFSREQRDLARDERPSARPPAMWELRASEKTGIPLEGIKAEFTDLWQKTDSGKALAAALEERGYMLAQGKSRAFVAVDHAGTVHSIAKRIEGVRVKDVRERFADIDSASLPKAEDAAKAQRDKYPTPEQARQAWEERAKAGPERQREATPELEATKQGDPEPEKAAPEKRINPTVETIRSVFAEGLAGDQLKAALENKGYKLACVSRDEAQESERAAAVAKQAGKPAQKFREDEIVVVNLRGVSYHLNSKTTGVDREIIEKRTAGIDRDALPSLSYAKAAQSERLAEQDAAMQRDAAKENVPMEAADKRINLTVSNIRHAASEGLRGSAFEAAMYDKGYSFARVTKEEAQASERAAAAAKEAGKSAPTYRENEILVVNSRGFAYRLNSKTTGLDRDGVRELRDSLDRMTGYPNLPSLMEVKKARSAERIIEQGERWKHGGGTMVERKILEVRDKASLEGKPVGEELHAEGIMLARVDAKGKAQMEVEYERQFENAKLLDIKQGTNDAWLREAKFEVGELVAVTRWGHVHRLNPNIIDTKKLEGDVTGGGTHTPMLSAAREKWANERQEKKDERAREWETKKEEWARDITLDRTAKAIKRAPGEAVKSVINAGFKVAIAKGVTSSLGSFAESLLGMGGKRPPANENEARQQQRAAYEALEDIADSIAAGVDLKAADVASLLPVQLQNLKRDGDAAMREMIEDVENRRQRTWDYSRERER